MVLALNQVFDDRMLARCCVVAAMVAYDEDVQFSMHMSCSLGTIDAFFNEFKIRSG